MDKQVELKITELALTKRAQMGRHETVNTRNEHYRQSYGQGFNPC